MEEVPYSQLLPSASDAHEYGRLCTCETIWKDGRKTGGRMEEERRRKGRKEEGSKRGRKESSVRRKESSVSSTNLGVWDIPQIANRGLVTYKYIKSWLCKHRIGNLTPRFDYIRPRSLRCAGVGFEPATRKTPNLPLSRHAPHYNQLRIQHSGLQE